MAEHMYIIAKREKITIFLECAPGESIASLKRLASNALKKDPSEFEFFKVESKSGHFTVNTGAPLDETRTVEASQLENDEVIAIVYRADGGFEDVTDLIQPLSVPTAPISDSGRGDA